MQHPHVPVELKSFGKHLFATFLGLLMALGLESCHQQHVQAKRAAQALEAVKAEMQSNRKELTDSLESVERNLGRLAGIYKAAEAVKDGKPVAGATPEFKLDLQLSELPTAAWDAAVAAQVVHYISFDKVQALSTAYKSQQLVDAQENALLEDVQRLIMSAMVLKGRNDFQAVQGTPKMDELIAAMKPVLIRLVILKQLQKDALQGIDGTIQKIKP